MKTKPLLVTISLAIHTYSYSQTVYIIIHGTWCTPFNWHMPDGDFYQAVNAAAQTYNAQVAFLQWPGKNSHAARKKGAQLLVNAIHTYKPRDAIHIIAHSHGGNVGFLASQLLEKTEYRITHCFTMGTPIDARRYAPNMNTIDKVFNLFSSGDMIQPVAGMYQRELPSHERIWNIRIMLNGTSPHHIPLHDPLLGIWIPIIDFWELTPGIDYLLELATGKQPTITQDHHRDTLREQHNQRIALYNDALRSKATLPDLSPSDQEPH